MIIGITGKKQAGKDTSALYIAERFKYKKLSLADPIKKACNIIFGWEDYHWVAPLKETVDPAWGISPRQAAQHLGTEWGQIDLCTSFELFNNITSRSLWVNRLLMSVKKDDNVVIADVRFHHEVKAIRDRGGFIIKVVGGEIGDLHISEMEMEEIIAEHTVYNDKGFDELYHQIDEIMRDIAWS